MNEDSYGSFVNQTYTHNTDPLFSTGMNQKTSNLKP